MQRPDRAIIPLAGLATRMHPLARVVPKELLPLGRRPVLHHVVAELARGGVRKVLLVLSERTRVIERYFAPDDQLDPALEKIGLPAGWTAGDEELSGCTFRVARQEVPRGIADAVHKGRDFVDGQPFFLHMGDSVLSGDPGLAERMAAAYERFGAACVVAVRRMPEPEIRARATVVPRGGTDAGAFEIEGIVEKPAPEEIRAPFAVIGRYLLAAPMLAVPRAGDLHSSPFGGLGSIFPDRPELEGPSVAVVCRPEAHLHDAGRLDGYLRALGFFALHDDTVGRDVREMAGREEP